MGSSLVEVLLVSLGVVFGLSVFMIVLMTMSTIASWALYFVHGVVHMSVRVVVFRHPGISWAISARQCNV